MLLSKKKWEGNNWSWNNLNLHKSVVGNTEKDDLGINNMNLL
jgi:hypothetical protein